MTDYFLRISLESKFALAYLSYSIGLANVAVASVNVDTFGLVPAGIFGAVIGLASGIVTGAAAAAIYIEADNARKGRVR